MNAHFCHTYGRFGRVECSDETIVFRFSGDLNLIEDDYIEIVGTFSKLYSYENAIRGTITVPFIDVKYVTLLLGRR
jgi:hypothetical protein